MKKILDGVNQQTDLAQVIIIEDDWVYSECLKKMFQSYDTNTVCYQFYSIAAFISDGFGLLSDSDMVILDINLGSEQGLDLIPSLRLHNSSVPIVVLSMASDYTNIKKAFQLGVSGYLLKEESLQEIYKQVMLCFKSKRIAITHTVLHNLVWEDSSRKRVNKFQDLFTERQHEVVTFLEKGLTQKEIASSMNISAGTVNQHLKHIYQKTNVRSKTELLFRMFQYS